MLKLIGIFVVVVFMSSCRVGDAGNDGYSAICGESISTVVQVEGLVGVWSNSSGQPLSLKGDDGVEVVNSEALNIYTYTFVGDGTYELYHSEWFPIGDVDGVLLFDWFGSHDYGTYVIDTGVILLKSNMFDPETDDIYKIEINSIKTNKLTLSSRDFCATEFFLDRSSNITSR